MTSSTAGRCEDLWGQAAPCPWTAGSLAPEGPPPRAAHSPAPQSMATGANTGLKETLQASQEVEFGATSPGVSAGGWAGSRLLTQVRPSFAPRMPREVAQNPVPETQTSFRIKDFVVLSLWL